MDFKNLKEQVEQRVKIAVEQHQLRELEGEQREKQKELLKKSENYHNVLRSQIMANLRVDDIGDYSDRLPWIHQRIQEVINAIPKELILQDAEVPQKYGSSGGSLGGLVRELVRGVEIAPKEGCVPEQVRFLEEVRMEHLKVVTFLDLLKNREILDTVLETTVGVAIGARLHTLFKMVNSQMVDQDDNPQFKEVCRQKWQNFFENIRKVNASGYFQTGESHIFYRSEWYDQPATFVSRKDEAEKVIGIFNRLRPFAESIYTVDEEKVEWYEWKGVGDTQGWLMEQVESLGVGCGNDCSCNRHMNGAHILKPSWEHMDKLLETMEKYEKNPLVASYILMYVASCTQYNNGMNCPETYSNGVWGKKPIFYLENIFDNEKVISKLLDVHESEKINNYVSYIFAQGEKFTGYHERMVVDIRWVDETKGDIEGLIINPWLKNLDNEEFWMKKERIEEEV